MKVNVTMYGQKGESQEDTTPAAHPVLYRMSQEVIQMLAVEMRKYSVSQLSLDVRSLGAVPVTSLRMKSLQDSDLPDELAYARPKLLRALQLYMEVYGIRVLGIDLSEEELSELKKYWSQLQSESPDGDDSIKMNNIPLRFERDPTDAEVDKQEDSDK